MLSFIFLEEFMPRYPKVSGIYPITWKNRDGSVVQKFRVKKACFKNRLDKIFNTFEEAHEAIKNFITPAYQTEINEKIKQDKKDKLSPNLEGLFNEYLKIESKNKSLKTQSLEKMYFTKTFPNILLYVGPLIGMTYPLWYKVTDPRELLRFGNLLVSESHIKTFHIERYILHRQTIDRIKDSTIRRELSAMGAFFSKIPFLSPYRSEHSPNPFLTLQKKHYLKDSQKLRTRRLSADENDRLNEALGTCRSKYLYLCAKLALTTGLRQSEMLKITWGNIDLAKKTICIPETKNGEIHYCAIAPPVLEIIQKFQQLNSPINSESRLIHYTTEGLKTTWGRVVKRANIKNYHWHDLRHEYLAGLIESGKSIYVVKALSRSKNIKHLEKKLDPVKRGLNAERLAAGGVLRDEDLGAVMNHSSAVMTAGYATLNTETLTQNLEIEAMRKEILELKNMMTNKEK